jgi:hypothetical protein
MTQTPQFPSGSSAYPESSQATLALGLGVVGLFFNPVGPIAWALGNGELKAIDAGRRHPENRSSAATARVLGIIGTVLLGISIAVVLFFVIGTVSFTSGV